MKVLTIHVENAVSYHEPDDRAPHKVLNTPPETYPVPEATETTVPVATDDFVIFRIVDRSRPGLIVIEFPVKPNVSATALHDDGSTRIVLLTRLFESKLAADLQH